MIESLQTEQCGMGKIAWAGRFFSLALITIPLMCGEERLFGCLSQGEVSVMMHNDPRVECCMCVSVCVCCACFVRVYSSMCVASVGCTPMTLHAHVEAFRL